MLCLFDYPSYVELLDVGIVSLLSINTCIIMMMEIIIMTFRAQIH